MFPLVPVVIPILKLGYISRIFLSIILYNFSFAILEYKINENKAVGLFKDKFIRIILIQDKEISSKEYDCLMDEMTNYVTALRPNRPSNPRNFNRANKYKTNMKPSY